MAIVGAGPAGFYAARALVERAPGASIDLIERLPTPHGLVRYGVAPDHEEVKSKAIAFDQILAHRGVRFLGNITVGEDLTRGELKAHYDAIIYTIGASAEADLNIPGEDLDESRSATEFVAWYNAHPDHAQAAFRLDHSHVAVVGMGNVALDVTRMLTKSPDALDTTDIASHAVEALRQSRVTDIHKRPSRTKSSPEAGTPALFRLPARDFGG